MHSWPCIVYVTFFAFTCKWGHVDHDNEDHDHEDGDDVDIDIDHGDDRHDDIQPCWEESSTPNQIYRLLCNTTCNTVLHHM